MIKDLLNLDYLETLEKEKELQKKKTEEEEKIRLEQEKKMKNMLAHVMMKK